MPHVADDVAGNKQVYGGNAPCEVQRSKVLADHMQALPAVRPRSLWVHGHPDKLHCLTHPDVLA